MVADGSFPAHEKATHVADCLERVVGALDLPLQATNVFEVAVRDLPALFWVVGLCVVPRGAALVHRDHAMERTETGDRVFSVYHVLFRQPLSLSLEASGDLLGFL